jgi:hypoxanthine phosphoribosyltransferase
VNKVHITNEDFGQMATNLCSQLVSIRNKFEWIVGIERGGVPLSTWLAYALGKKHTSIWASRYGDGMISEGFSLGKTKALPTIPFLLVDDIVDTGLTIKHLKQHIPYLPKFWIATLHWCPENSLDCKPDFYVQTKKAGDWLIYPWESEKSP